MRRTPPSGTMLRPGIAVALALVLAAVVLAGCVHPDDNDDTIPTTPGGSGGGHPPAQPPGDSTSGPGGNEPVDPVVPGELSAVFTLQAAAQVGWAGEDNLTFDASDFSVTNGNVTGWTFDLGDGTNLTLEADEQPIVTHTYETGGVYWVNVTMHAEGEAIDNETQTVTAKDSAFAVVHERHIIPETELSVGLLGQAQTDLKPFDLNPVAIEFKLGLEIENTATGLLASDAEGNVQVIDPEGEILAEKEFTIGVEEVENLTLDGDFGNLAGEYIVQVRITDGQIKFSGQLEVYYGVGSDA